MIKLTLDLDNMSFDQWEKTRSMVDHYYSPIKTEVVDVQLNADGTEKQYGDCESTVPDVKLDGENVKVITGEVTCGSGLVNMPTVDLDPDGLPWDHRIHASSKARNNDGRWKKKKGVSEELYETVRKELLSIPQAPTTPEPSEIPKPPASGGSPVPAAVGASTTNTTAPGVVHWPELMSRLQKGIQEKRVDPSKVMQWLNGLGIEGGVPMLANHPNLHAAFLDEFDI